MGTMGFTGEVGGSQPRMIHRYSYLNLGVRKTAGSRERGGYPELGGPLPRIRVTRGQSEREGVEGFRITGVFNRVWCQFYS